MRKKEKPTNVLERESERKWWIQVKERERKIMWEVRASVRDDRERTDD